MCHVALQFVITTSALMLLPFFNYKSKRLRGHVLSATKPLLSNISRLISLYSLVDLCSNSADKTRRYVDDILKSTPKTIDQVTIEPNGKWCQTSGSDPPPRTAKKQRSCNDDEDLIEIDNMPRLASVKSEATHEYGSIRTPPTSSREASSPLAQPLSKHNKKRPAGQVVDLTLSSDEDDESPRGSKRQVKHKSSIGLSKFTGSENMPLRPNVLNGEVPRQHPANLFPALACNPRDPGHPP